MMRINHESLKHENPTDAMVKNYDGEIQELSPVYPQKQHAFENIDLNNVIDDSNWISFKEKIVEVDKQLTELENTLISTLLSKFPKNADLFNSQIGNVWKKLIEDRNWKSLNGMVKKGRDEILTETAKTLMENFISKFPDHAVLFKQYIQILSKKWIDEKNWEVLNAMMMNGKYKLLKEIVFKKVNELKKSDADALKMRYNSTDINMKRWDEIHAGNVIEYEKNLLKLFNNLVDIQKQSLEKRAARKASEKKKAKTYKTVKTRHYVFW